MKLFSSSVVVILLAVGFQSKNAVQSEVTVDDNPKEATVENSTKPTTSPDETLSPSKTELSPAPVNIQPPLPESTTSSINNVPSTTEQNQQADMFTVINSEETVTTSSKLGTAEDHQSLRSANGSSSNNTNTLTAEINSPSSNKKDKLVAEMIKSIPNGNNSYVLANLLNFSYNKTDISHIGEPFELGPIQDWEFPSDLSKFHDKITKFRNIHATDASIKPADMFYNNFSCASKHSRIVLNVIPENMTFEGDYTVIDNRTNVQFNGSFLFNQTGAKLSCELADISLLHHNNCDIIFANGEVKFTQLCDDQCDLLASSAEMLHNVKLHMLKQLSIPLITKKAGQFASTFPFLSTCSSSPSVQTKNYYIINKTITKTYKSCNLQLGPMILKGLDNFTTGNVIASKSGLHHTPNGFFLTTKANHIQGQCDWHYFKGSNHDSSSKHSFTFIIEEVKFTMGVEFSEIWNADSLEINLGKISIHRLNKAHPKMLDFMKSVLEDFVQEAVIDSLKGLFRAQFPELIPSTRTSTESTMIMTNKTEEYNTKTKTTETRQVVYWTSLRPRNQANETVSDNDHLPFPNRRVVKPCKDTRKWWQKIFYRNPCKRVSIPDDS